MSGARRWRNYDARERRNSVGREIAGTELKISEQEVQTRIDVAWDKAKQWKSTTRAILLHYRDNGSGYFNYRETRVEHEVEWDGERWLVRVGGSAGRQDYGVQKSDEGGLTPPPRIKDEYTAELYVERTLSPRWLAFAKYSWERNRSNDPFATYRVNEGLLGIRWSWEK